MVSSCADFSIAWYFSRRRNSSSSGTFGVAGLAGINAGAAPRVPSDARATRHVAIYLFPVSSLRYPCAKARSSFHGRGWREYPPPAASGR